MSSLTCAATSGEFRTQSALAQDNCYGIIGTNGAGKSTFLKIKQYAKDTTETYLRSFLGWLLFSGDDVLKPVNVFSGGEKVRCMFSRMMMYGSNVLVMDQPTNHLDLESITAVNNGLANFKGVILFTSHDHQFVETVANRIIELKEENCIDRVISFDEYIELAKTPA